MLYKGEINAMVGVVALLCGWCLERDDFLGLAPYVLRPTVTPSSSLLAKPEQHFLALDLKRIYDCTVSRGATVISTHHIH